MPLHSLGFLFVISPIAGYAILGRRLRRLPGWQAAGRFLSNISSPGLAALTVAFCATFNPEQAGANRGIAGLRLTQRVLILTLQSSLIALALQARRQRPANAPEPIASRA